jgi:hypothetical protein
MRTRTSKRESEMDLTIDGRDYTVTFAWTVTGWRENYGSDADGNRGVMTDMRETDLSPAIVVTDDDGVLVILAPAAMEQVRATLEAYIDSDDAYADDQDEEPDPDREDD